MPVVPLPPVATTGVYTSSQLSALIAAVNFAENPPAAQVRQATLQTIATSTFTAVTFDTEDFDTDVDGVGGHDNVTNNSRYTARYPGRYKVSGAVGWTGNATGRRISAWAVNGIQVNGSQLALPTGTAVGIEYPARTMFVFLNANDYVELQAFQETGGNLNTDNGAIAGSVMAVQWVRNS